MNIPDGIYYIVLADLIGSTGFGVSAGDDALRDRIDYFAEAANKAIENAKKSSNSGRFIKQVGDGILVLFKHFPDIVQWQMEFDGLLGLAGQRHEPFEVRICVHAGEVRFRKGDPMALAVNQLFKMEKAAGSGQLLLTEVAHRLALPSLHPKQCVFEEGGTVRLAGYNRPVQLYRLVVKADIAFLINKTYRKSQIK